MGRKEEAIRQITKSYISLYPILDERSRRQWAATEAESYGQGGSAWVCEATGMSHNTITGGMKEIIERREHPTDKTNNLDRIRKEGGGRKLLEEKDRELAEALNKLVEPATRGDPMSALCWTSKSTYTLAAELGKQAHGISPRSVSALLKAQGFRLQTNRKTKEGTQHPDRNEQFEYINSQAIRFMRQGLPVISVDTKKKEKRRKLWIILPIKDMNGNIRESPMKCKYTILWTRILARQYLRNSSTIT